MDFDSVISVRRSVRGFTETSVAPELVSEIVTLAQRTPSWCNSQAWQLDITGPAETARLSAALLEHARSGTASDPDIAWPEKYEGIYADRRRACGYALYESLGIERSDQARRSEQALENFKFFGAPHVAIVTSPRALGAYGFIDCGGFVSTFQYAAQSRGVATIAQAAPTMYSAVLREFFSISDDRVIICAIAFGYADDSHPANQFRTERDPADAVIRWHDS